MKIPCLSILLFLIIGNADAQSPVFTTASEPQPGETFIIQPASSVGISPGSAGANQVWDFSTLEDTGASYFISAAVASATPYADSFPGSTLALLTNAGVDTGYAYYTTTNNKVSYTGGYFGAAGYVFYTSPIVYWEYPSQFNSAFVNSIAGYTTNDDAITGVDSVLQDGYGTLKMPGHTYTNVIRTKILFHQHSVNNGFAFYENIDEVEYMYSTPGVHNYLLDIQFATNDVNGQVYGGNSVLYTKNASTGISDVFTNALELHVYPNPSQGTFTVKIAAEIKEATMTLTDLLGNEVFSQRMPASSQQIHVNDLSKGMYILHVRSDSGNAGTQKIIIE